MKYENRIKTVEKEEINIPKEALKTMEIREVNDNEVPIAIVKYGITLFIGIFIL
jgi:hypothetical protein